MGTSLIEIVQHNFGSIPLHGAVCCSNLAETPLGFFIVNPKVTVECEGESIAWRVTGVLFNGARNLIVRNCFELRGVQSRSGGGGATPTAPDEPAALG